MLVGDSPVSVNHGRRIGICAALVGSIVAAACGGHGAQPTPAPSPVVTVTAIAISGQTTLPAIGSASSLQATASLSDGSSRNVTTDAVWISDHPLVIGVTAAGQAQAVGPGDATITASYQGHSGTLAMRVTLDANRNTNDLADETGGYKVKALYVVPSDGEDRHFDTEGSIEAAIEAIEEWLSDVSGGQRLNVDTFQGRPDVAFLRLGRSDAEIAAAGIFARDRLEDEVRASGFRDSRKIYLVFYDGGNPAACGGGPWPPSLVGHVAAVYLKGTPPGAPPCDTNPWGRSAGTMGYREFSALHEVFHTLGAVATCAPHHTMSGHVSDDPADLMYAGSLPWTPSQLDVGRDDYFGHGRNCLDVSHSAFLTGGSVPPPGW